MARAQGSRAQMALAFESSYGTAPASGFVKMPFASTSLGAAQPLLDSELLGYGRDPLAPIKDAVTVDGDVVVPIDAIGFGYWLKMMFGAPVTTGSDPYTHTFSSGALVLPSASIEIGMPEIPRFAMYSGVMANTLSISMARKGLLTAKLELLAQGEDIDTSAASGTLADIALTRFGHFNGAIKREGSSLASVTAAEVMYSNNLDPAETIRADGKIDGADPSVAAMSGKIDLRFADTVLMDQALSGDPCSLEFSWTLSASASLTISVGEVYLPRPRVEISGPAGIQASFDWQASQVSGGGAMCTAVLINGKSGY